jgi:glycosyltransferase involved in cell wall biosynthesis
MNLGLVIYGGLDTISGGYLYDRKLVEWLRRQGDEVEIISLPVRGYSGSILENFTSAVHRALDGLQVDALLQDELCHPSLFWLNTRLKSPVPRLAIVHHLRSSEQRPAWKNSLYRLIERAYLQSVDGFIFNSLTTKTTVFDLLDPGPPQPPAHVVATPAGDRFNPNILETEIVERAGAPSPLRLVFLGNLIPRKGLVELLRAMQRMPSGSATLKIIGNLTIDPVYTARCRYLASAPPLAGLVDFLGPLDDMPLASVLRSSQVLVVPSSYEGYGIAYLEGMSFGLPAIGCAAGAAGEVITHGQDGWLVAPGNVPAMAEALAEALAALANDRDRLAALSLAARRRYLRQPTWENTGQKIREFLERYQ